MSAGKSSQTRTRTERRKAAGQIVFSIIALVVILSFIIAAIEF